MTIRIITDIHYNPADHGSKLSTHTLPLLCAQFNAVSADERKKTLTLNLGDFIIASRKQTLEERRSEDLKNADAILSALAQMDVRHHLPGNHEDRSLSRPDMSGIAHKYGAQIGSQVLEHDGLSIVLWAPDTSMRKENGGTLPVAPADLDWLRNALKQAGPRAVVMTHIPLDGDVTDFSRSAVDGQAHPILVHGATMPYAVRYPNAPEIRRIIAGSGKVIACIAGHTHWNHASCHDGVAYITVPSLVERVYDAAGKALPWNGSALIEYDAEKGEMSVEIGGLKPASYRVASGKKGGSLTIGR